MKLNHFLWRFFEQLLENLNRSTDKIWWQINIFSPINYLFVALLLKKCRFWNCTKKIEFHWHFVWPVILILKLCLLLKPFTFYDTIFNEYWKIRFFAPPLTSSELSIRFSAARWNWNGDNRDLNEDQEKDQAMKAFCQKKTEGGLVKHTS